MSRQATGVRLNVMHAKKYSSGATTEGAYGHIAFMNVTIGVEDCLKNKKLRLTNEIPQDPRPVLNFRS